MWRWISNEIKFTMVFVIVLLLFILIIIKYLLQLKYWIVTYIIHQLTSQDQTDNRVTKQCSFLPSKKITGGGEGWGAILDNKLNLSFLAYWRGEFGEKVSLTQNEVKKNKI